MEEDIQCLDNEPNHLLTCNICTFFHTLHKKHGNLRLANYFFVVMLLGQKSYTVGNPTGDPFKLLHL